MSNVFGKAYSTSSSSNNNIHDVTNALDPVMNTGAQANSQIGNMLGLNGAQGQNQAFQNWQNSTGYQFGLNQGMNSITGNAATQGLLNSGSTAKALNTYGQNYANTQYGNYTNQLQGLTSSGLGASSSIANVGQRSNSEGQGANGGVGGLISSGIGSMLGK